MNKFLPLALLIGVSLTGNTIAKTGTTALPDVKLSQLPDTQQAPEHSTVSERVTSRFLHSHYRQFQLDAEFSAKILERYLNLLDYSHNVFLASDVAAFSKNKAQVGSYLQKGELQPLYELFNLSQKRRFERFEYALARLKQPMNFDGDDVIATDRGKAPWPQTEAELNNLWDAKVKYDWLTLKLSGKDDKEIKETLTKRYTYALKRLTQTKSEDVFQLIMTAFAREIDPHTSYLSPRNTEQFNSEMSLSLEGIGAVLRMDDDYTVINSLVAGGPALKSKELAVGDKILAVGQTGKPMVDVVGWRLDDVVSQIKGAKGSKVRLEVLGDTKGAKPRIVTLTREQIRLEDRAVKMTIKQVGNQKVAVLNIPGFYVGLTNDTKTQLQKLAKEKVDAVIIDLRGNGGGALTEAVDLSGLFITSGPVVQVRDNNGRVREDADTDDVIYYKGPLVVMVDRLSASASEIFAAAMQDYGRALIVGEPTFGKGTVQQHRPISRIYDQMLRPEWPDLGSVQYTIQKFYRINGGSTQRKGVTPDIIMPTGYDNDDIGESFEDNALPWDSITPAQYSSADVISKAVPELALKYQERTKTDPEFGYIHEDLQRYKANKATQDVISLNFTKRDKEDKELEATRLKRINERYVREGKKPILNLEALPKDYEGPDAYLEETVKIAADLAKVPDIEKSAQ